LYLILGSLTLTPVAAAERSEEEGVAV